MGEDITDDGGRNKVTILTMEFLHIRWGFFESPL